jgi:hypothetical protein
MAVVERIDRGRGARDAVHQALHGYRDGHRLLASSMPLPRVALDGMLALTDAVDVYDDPAFAELLAIYPLQETNWIAISLTWPATDAGRAGAVWTHTLIMEPATLAKAGPDLVELFRRPGGATKSELRPYDEGLVIDVGPRAARLPRSLAIPARIAWALYESPARPVIADASELPPDARHRLLVGLAAQYTPTFSPSLAFAEAGSHPRQLLSRSFDLILTGRRGMSVLPRASRERPRVMPASTHVSPPSWAALLAVDAFSPDRLSAFVRQFGPEARGQKDAVKPLAQIYAEFHESTGDPATWATALQILSGAFPRRSDMRQLKISIFGSPHERMRDPDLDEMATLVLLLRDSHARCLSTVDLKLAERAASIAESVPEGATELLHTIAMQDRTPETAKAICAGLASGLSSSALADLASRHPGLLAVLVDVHPGTLGRPELWEAPPALLVDALSDRIADPVRRAEIIASAARSQNVLLAETLVDRWPSEVESSISAILASPSASDAWTAVLPPRTLSEWLATEAHPSPGQVLTVASRLTASQASLVPTEKWLAASPAIPSAPFNERAFATLLCVAVKSDDRRAAELACGLVERLWDSAVHDELRRDDVRLDLRRLSKTPSDADIPDRVILRVSKSFATRGWPAESALRVQNADAFERLLESDAAARSGASVALRLLSSVDGDATTDQVRVIESVVKRHARRDDLLDVLAGFIRRLTAGP